MIFKTAAVALLLPPVSLVFVALIGLLIERRHRPIGRFLAWFGVLGLLVLALPAVSGLLLMSLERNLPLTPPPDRPPQAIVILGGDIQPAAARRCSRISARCRWSACAPARCCIAAPDCRSWSPAERCGHPSRRSPR